MMETQHLPRQSAVVLHCPCSGTSAGVGGYLKIGEI